MIQAFYTGKTGAAEHQKMMSITANNMANVSTDGFKASNATFQELLHQRVRMPNDYENRPGVYEARNNYNTRNWNRGAPPAIYDEDGEPVFRSYPGNIFTENKLRVGSGSRVSENALVMTQGNLVFTDDNLTVALSNPRAFFAVLNPHYENEDASAIYYTRSGRFSLSIEGDGIFLVTGSGEYILDEDFERIMLNEDMDKNNIIFMPHGYPADEGEGSNVIRLGVYTFNNIYGLEHIGGNRYVPTEFSGEAEIIENLSDNIIRQHYIEASNVNIADEMVRVIQAQRAFQSNLTVIRTADEIEAYVNQLNGQ